MGLYVKKKSNSFIKNFIYIIFLVLVGYLSYYYFFIYSKEITKSIINENTNNLTASNNIINSESLELLFQKFIQENPELILNSLKDYQEILAAKDKAENNSKYLSHINRLSEVKSNMFIGSNQSDKEIYVFVDYNCGYCLQLNNQLLKLIDLDSSIKIHTVQLPILSNSSSDFAKLVIASSIQGDFQAVHNYLYSKSRRTSMNEIFADLFLMDIDIRSIKDNIQSKQVSDILLIHKEISNLFNLRGTPAIIIGTEIIPGFIELSKIMEILQQEFPVAS